ncbi:MAG: hypothetical protein K0S65_2426, partial [Labilithrix sp.]|nr:hypothetical protein [Labilithrix sp.]
MKAVGVILLVVSTWGAPQASVPPGPAKGAAAPVAPLQPPTVDLVITVRPGAVVAQNVRDAAVLYRVAFLDQMKLFTVADRIAESYRKGQLPVRSESSRAKLAAYDAGLKDRLTADERIALATAVTELVQMEFETAPANTTEQMNAYAELVAAVSQSVDDFRNDNVTPNEERDRLADNTRTAAYGLALSMSNRGYGAAHVAAARLAAQVRQALALLEDGEIQSAYGTRSM